MTGFARVFAAELARIFTLAPVFSVLILASVIYAAFYPQPYLNEALRNVPIAVVDRDRTAASRQFVRAVDASADVAVVAQYADLPSAERAVFAREISGILHIPQHFERDLLHGRPSPVAVYGDASYFLIYQRVAGAVTGVAAAMGASVEAGRLIAAGVDPAIAAAAVDPMPLVAVPLFNPEGGYATYILPAAFALILQQVLLIAVGLLGTLPGQPLAMAGAVATVTGRLAAYLAVEAVLLPTYLVVLPWLYGLPRLGDLQVLLLFAIPFVLSVGALGQVLARIFRKPMAVQLVTASMGLPLFFLAGFSWPVEAIPPALHLVALAIPSTSAIPGFVSITQAGATLADVHRHFAQLWILAAAYTALAVILEASRRRNDAGSAPITAAQ